MLLLFTTPTQLLPPRPQTSPTQNTRSSAFQQVHNVDIPRHAAQGPRLRKQCNVDLPYIPVNASRSQGDRIERAAGAGFVRGREESQVKDAGKTQGYDDDGMMTAAT